LTKSTPPPLRSNPGSATDFGVGSRQGLRLSCGRIRTVGFAVTRPDYDPRNICVNESKLEFNILLQGTANAASFTDRPCLSFIMLPEKNSRRVVRPFVSPYVRTSRIRVRPITSEVGFFLTISQK